MSTAAADSRRAAIAAIVRYQVEECRRLGSPLYVGMLEAVAADVEAGGPAWELLRGESTEGPFTAMALRLMGAVNRLAQSGEEPAAFEDWEHLREVLARRREDLLELIELPVQTNEVARSPALALGFLAVAARTGLPLRTLELGASAGLNSNWDRYRYDVEGFTWGPVDSPLRLDHWRLLHPIDVKGAKGAEYPERVEVASREGCDAAPIDPTTPEGRQTLLAYVWPDQAGRIERLKAALEIAAAHPVPLERSPAAAWARERLAEPVTGVATVVFHSIFAFYMEQAERDELQATIAAAGARSDDAAPLAWLRLESAGEIAELRLTTWPGGEERLLARTGFHGDPVELLESPW